MLMSDGEIALDEVIVACKETAHCYQQAIDSIENAQLSGLLQGFLQQRQTYIRELETHLRELGHLPREPDADKETVHDLFNRAKVLLAADDDRLKLLEEREQAEAQLADQVKNALQQTLPESVLTTLRRLQTDVDTVRERLAMAKANYQKS
jgi:uncharacterized protein (TIGR02284 family)